MLDRKLTGRRGRKETRLISTVLHLSLQGKRLIVFFFFFSNVLSFLGIFFKSHTFLLFVTTDLLLSIHLLLLGSGNFGTLLSVTSNALIIDGENSERGKLNEFQDVNM